MGLFIPIAVRVNDDSALANPLMFGKDSALSNAEECEMARKLFDWAIFEAR